MVRDQGEFSLEESEGTRRGIRGGEGIVGTRRFESIENCGDALCLRFH